MVIKVKHKELKDVEKKLLNNSEKLNVEIENLLQYLNELQNVWQGLDADIFYDDAYNYVNKMKSISECFNVMGKFMNGANTLYQDNDNSLKQELEKEATNSEQYNNNQF